MDFKLKIIILLTLFTSGILQAQDAQANKIKKIINKEVNYVKTGNSIVFETLSPVSIQDFMAYQKDVRDSIAIETIFFSIEEDKESLDYLNAKKKLQDHPSEREINRSLFTLNRNVKNLYDEMYHVPILQVMKIPRYAKFLHAKELYFDDRCNFYETNENKRFKYADTALSSSAYSIFHNHWKIAQYSASPYDIPNVLAQTLPVIFKNSAPYDITESQYKAYIDWKTKKIKLNLKKKKINASVELVPFFKVDTFSFIIQGKTLFDQWVINGEEYKEFMGYAYDSLKRDKLFFDLLEWDRSNKFIDYHRFYFCEKYLAWVEFDPGEKEENRTVFNLNFDAKIKEKDPEISTILNSLARETESSFTYSYRRLTPKDQLEKSQPLRKCTYKNEPFFKIDTINVKLIRQTPSNSEQNFMRQLNYEQALAFYNWKYPISKCSPLSNWNDFVFPSKEEFELMMSGKSEVFENKTFSYTAKTLRYKVVVLLDE